jgi:RNA polymerase sigma factor (sigma-70 family)
MSFEAWYVGYHPTLVAALTVVAGDRDAGRDAADEALVRALERWDRVQAMDSPEGWTYRVGVNLLRRRGRRRALERRHLARPEPAPSLVDAADVWLVVCALPRRQREAIALRYLLGLSEAEVAETMGVAVGTASATLASARVRLGAWLREDPMEVS